VLPEKGGLRVCGHFPKIIRHIFIGAVIAVQALDYKGKKH